MKLSVIIPTRNRAPLLEKALKSLVIQTLSQEHFEVIIVDNGSTDNSFDVVNSFKTRLRNIRYFLEHQPGLHVGRHKGFIEAESNLLVYADDDIEAFPTWLQAIKESFADEEVVMVGGKCLPRFEAEPPDWLNAMWSSNAAGERILGYLSVIDLGDDTKPVNPYHVFGCNFAIRRSVLLEAGGFHPDGMPQELIRFRGDGESYVSKHVQTKGYKALYNPLASIYHWVPASRMTIEYFCRRSYNQGISDSYTQLRKAQILHINPTQSARSLTLLIRILRNIRARWRAFKSQNRELRELHDAMRKGYQNGFAYHQRAYRDDPEIKIWVHKTDYFAQW